MKTKPTSSETQQIQPGAVVKRTPNYEKPPSKYKFRYHKYTGESVPEPTKLAVVAMREAGMSLVEVAAKAGLSTNIVSAIERLYDPPKALIERYKKGMAGRLYRVANDAVEQIEPDSLQYMTAYQCMGIAGLAIQNARLIEGQSTENVAQLTAIIQAVDAPDVEQGKPEEIVEAEEVK